MAQGLTGIAVLLCCILMWILSGRVKAQSNGLPARLGVVAIRVLILLFALGDTLLLSAWAAAQWEGRYREPPLAFSGDSSGLTRTVVVPTLDTPVPEGQNVVWCASFALAWDRLRADVVKGPVRISGEEDLCARLNVASVPAGSLPEHCFAAVGFARDGIAESVDREVRRIFGRPAEMPALPLNAIAVYAELEASLPFPVPYAESRSGIRFRDAQGNESTVGAFGAWEDEHRRAREQARLLWVSEEIDGKSGQPAEFVVDPCASSGPDQLILALVPRQASLAEALAYVDSKIGAAGEPQPLPACTFLIPNFHWEIDHHFRELEGESRTLRNEGLEEYYVDTALQKIRFRLDRSGAELRSISLLVLLGKAASRFVFDRPFLLVMKRRDASAPYFAMWVDNAELLCGSETGK